MTNEKILSFRRRFVKDFNLPINIVDSPYFEYYMSTYYPKWYERYPDCKKAYSYLTDSASMSWNRKTLSDEEGLTQMSAEEVLKWMFENQQGEQKLGKSA